MALGPRSSDQGAPGSLCLTQLAPEKHGREAALGLRDHQQETGASAGKRFPNGLTPVPRFCSARGIARGCGVRLVSSLVLTTWSCVTLDMLINLSEPHWKWGS